MRPKFQETIQIRAPEGFSAALSTLAQGEYVSVSEIIRRCVFARLREAGVSLEGKSGSPSLPPRQTAPEAGQHVGA
jgi:hypothetical protein